VCFDTGEGTLKEMTTMTINPAFLQGALLRNMVQNPLSGTGSTAKVTAQQSDAAMKDMLAQRSYGLRKRMNEAQTTEMANKLALSKGYLEIDRGKYGIEEKQLGLAEQRLGLANQEQNWREKNWRKGYDTEKQNMWTTAALGLGTAGWSAYEGSRRADLIRAEAEKNKKFMDGMSQYFNKGGTP
jgi:hypothetical protein